MHADTETDAANEPVYMGLPDARYLSPRFWLAVALCVPLLALSMGSMLPGLAWLAHVSWNGYAQALLATPVFLWCGAPFIRRWWTSLRERDTNMFTLIVSGTGAAWLYSVAALFLGDHFPASLKGAHGVPLYFEAAAVTTAIVLLGQILEQRANARTESALRELMALTPPSAHLVRDGIETDVPAEQVRPGDLLRIRPGEAVPVDGLVSEGSSDIDESMLTGESMPVSRRPGDTLRAGTHNTHGSLLMKATHVGEETVLASIIRLVREAQESEAPIQRLADKAAGFFVPVVAGIAALTFLAWLLFGPEPRFIHALVSAVAVMVVSCPCTLGLATPVAVVTGIGRGARAGILFKQAEAMERLASTDTLYIDKTGTLTKGKPSLAGLRAQGTSEDELLRLAASAEAPSEHPLARAIVKAATERGLRLDSVTEFKAVPGVGVAARLGSSLLEVRRSADEGLPSECTGVELFRDGVSLGSLLLRDEVRPGCEQVVRQLQGLGLRLHVLSGDREAVVASVCARLGIAEHSSQLSPGDKQARVAESRARGARVAFAGDGINDAPALAAAEVGIAMGSGSGVAIASAGVILMQGDLHALERAVRLSRSTLGIIRQNLFWAFFYNGLCIPLAAGLFYPFLGWQLNPMVAGLAMSLSSLTVVSNALRLRTIRL
jgi:Cu+-exporting ATPase